MVLEMSVSTHFRGNSGSATAFAVENAKIARTAKIFFIFRTSEKIVPRFSSLAKLRRSQINPSSELQMEHFSVALAN